MVFVEKTNHRKPTSWKEDIFPNLLADHPVVGVSWEDAKFYCQFMGKRLLTESEWEYAIRGSNGRKYSWDGLNFSSNFAITRESGSVQSKPVYLRNKDITKEGVSQMSGNVREYVADYYRPYDSERFEGDERVIRGSSWAFSFSSSASFSRLHFSSSPVINLFDLVSVAICSFNSLTSFA